MQNYYILELRDTVSCHKWLTLCEKNVIFADKSALTVQLSKPGLHTAGI